MRSVKKTALNSSVFHYEMAVKNKCLSQPEMNGQRENLTHYVTDFQEVDLSP